MPPRVRRPDPVQVADAFAAQQHALGAWLGARDSSAPAGEPDLAGLIALLCHTRDLHPLRPDDPPPYERSALAIVTRALVDRLAGAAPGRSVEVRVPPFAATQCIEGPPHKRGKPASVVETDPLTWLDLATGRITWAAATASGRVSANGERSDLSSYLPLTPA